MLIILSIALVVFISFVLYCIVHCTTSYDNEIDDEQQELFLNAKK